MSLVEFQLMRKVERLERLVRFVGWLVAVLVAGALVVGLGYAALQEQRAAHIGAGR